MITGKSNEAICTQTSHLIKSVDVPIREEIIKNFKYVKIPAAHVASIKASLNLPWNLLQDLRRWLKTFEVNLSSEKITRQGVKGWVRGVRCEEVPAMVVKDKKDIYRVEVMAILK